MQKTFIKYTAGIVTIAIFLILFINAAFSSHMLEAQQFDTFYAKTEQMIHTVENNQEELRLLNESLNEDYLTRAKAAAYVMDKRGGTSMSVSQMQYLANLLNVDELHMIDENGIIAQASVAEYIGMDMHDHDQTRPFVALLETDDKDAYYIQQPRPNAAIGKLMQYIGVVRKSQKGFVQVGFTPTRQLEAQSRNTYDYIFSKFPTDIGEELYVVDCSTGELLGHSGGMEMDFHADCYRLENLFGCTQGAFEKGRNGEEMYVVSRRYDDVMLCAALPRHTLFSRLWSNVLANFFYLLFIEAAVIFLLSYLVRKKVIRGIHNIIEDLDAITNGNLDTSVSVGGNREFEELSSGINTMVKSIVSLSDRISAIIEISGIPLAAFEYESGINHVFATSGLSRLLELTDREAARLYRDASRFDKYIRFVTQTPISGETDIYRIRDDRYVRIHMSDLSEGDGYLGIITDVTKDVQQKQQMQYENTHDALTGLYKFAHFKTLAAEKLENIRPGTLCALAMIDLDYFKSINDTYGHDIGDHYLKSFASILSSMPADQFLCARRSGDEFCLMLFDCFGKTDIENCLNNLYQSLLDHPVKLSETDLKCIRISCGYAYTDDKSAAIAELLAHADEALYEVKNTTRGRYTEYHPQPL